MARDRARARSSRDTRTPGGARQASGGGSFLLMAAKSNPGRALHDFVLETDSNSIQIREEQHWSKRLEIEETAGDAGDD
ncbi:hypothetical protein TRIUR3_24939 [Triticum urartu]|uniref:Uncharacterized protein n=1 Tax=Triticum urartu TaxID=4572 RepID=M8A898_TRIUA|nr:hypothetical protein TRIUR3_24939 [Triticum urartu]